MPGPARIFAFVDDLFFLTKIQETGRKLNVKVEFVKTDKDLYERMGQNGDDKPSLIIFDLNNLGAKPLTLIPKLKSKLKKWLPKGGAPARACVQAELANPSILVEIMVTACK